MQFIHCRETGILFLKPGALAGCLAFLFSAFPSHTNPMTEPGMIAHRPMLIDARNH